MSEIAYPPNCQPVNYQLLDSLLEERLIVNEKYSMAICYNENSRIFNLLQKIINYFRNFNYNCDDIYKYYSLWTHLNEIAELHSSEMIALLAICASTEICRSFKRVPVNLSKYISPKNFQNLYILLPRFLKDINDDDSKLTWIYHLLRVFAEDELFSLTQFSTVYVDIMDNMFVKMINALLYVGSQHDLRENIYELVKIGLLILIESTYECVSPIIVLKEVLLPLLSETPGVRRIIKKCIPRLGYSHMQVLCGIITRRIILREKSEHFLEKELVLAEKTIMLVKNVQIFETIYTPLYKESFKNFHPDHEQIIRILCALIVRNTKYAKDKWEYIELEAKKDIQTMVSRFYKAMMRDGFKPYTNILIDYGDQLLQNAPCVEITFRYFEIFKHYIKISNADQRNILIHIFDENLNKYIVSHNM